VQDGTDTKAKALAAAALLERWADAVPTWAPDAGETWNQFAERRYRAEQVLEERLRRLPTCELALDATGSHVDLVLAGVRVPRQNCLANACRAWASEIRRRTDR